MELTPSVLEEIGSCAQEARELLMELARIPAPSNHEQKRAAFCKDWLERQGARGVYIDEALNVVYPVGCTDENRLAVFMAHSDVVFPDMEPLPLKVEDGKIFCPGVGDDTANVVALLMAAKYIARHGLAPRDRGIVLVVNSGEEGLGNLKGAKRIVAQYGSRIDEFISFDSASCSCVDRAVGSKRYRIEVETEGGHSYGNFGNRNAIACLASVIDTLYAGDVPPIGRTTYNVGTISGGTSVNTIAQHAQMLYEFRSDERRALDIMEERLQSVLADYRSRGIEIRQTLVGDRPCGGDVDPEAEAALAAWAARAVERYFGQKVQFRSGSTDCNIPLAAGIPAVCVGCCLGSGAHTRQEYVLLDSLLPGLKVAFELILHHF